MDIHVTHSLISVASIKQLLNRYAIGEITSCHFLTRGLNDTYVITTRSDKYTFRVYRHGWRNQSDILFELEAINHLRRSEFPVSYPIRTHDGKWMNEIEAPEGLRYGVLFTFSRGERPNINPENCRFIGQALADLHLKSDGFFSPHKRSFDLDLGHLLLEPTTAIQRHLDFTANIYIPSELEWGFCHGDFHNFNMHIDGSELEIFDFDCCGFGFRAYDVAVFWWNLKNNYAFQEEACWDQFLNGYLSKRNLPDVKSLPLFISVRRIWLLGTMLENQDVWGTQWINPANLNRFLADLQKDCEQFC